MIGIGKEGEKMKRVVFIMAAAFLTLALAAQGGERLWPRGTPTVYVGFGAGGGTDTAVRPLIAKMQEYLNETINVVNMPGASSAVAAEHVVNLSNDGYNMFATGTGCYGGFLVQSTAPNSYPWKWTGWYPIQGPAALLTNPAKSGINTLDEAIAKLKDGSVSVCMSGFGNGPHVLMETFAGLAGITDINYVTFDGDGNVAVGVFAGEVELGIITFSSGIDHARAGNVKVLFLNQTEPLPLTDTITAPPITQVFPAGSNMPMLSEAWPVLIRRDAPATIIAKLEEAFRWAVKQPDFLEFATSRGANVVALSGEEADKLADYQFSAYAWTQWAGRPDQTDPASIGLVKPSDWNWNVEKKKYGY
jgi:tripartite-type tricarboxylate transporter receptor subunit TctC